MKNLFLLFCIGTTLVFAGCENIGAPEHDTYAILLTVADNAGSAEAQIGGSAADKAAGGASVTLTATPYEDFTFVCWEVNTGSVILADTGANPASFIMPAENVSIEAIFAYSGSYPITKLDCEHGFLEVTIHGSVVTEAREGEYIIITATPETGYLFNGWTTAPELNFNHSTNPVAIQMPACGVIIGAEFAFDIFPANADPRFKEYCTREFDVDGDGILSISEAEAVESIDLSSLSYKLASLAGIECFPNISSLICSGLALTSLDLSNNTELLYLDCSENQLTTLNVSNNETLTQLYCDDNQLMALDMSNNPALTQLDCSNNQLTTLNVSNNPALTQLDCSNNQSTTLNVSGNSELLHLNCYDNQLTALNVSNNTALIRLVCGNNQLTTLDVASNSELQHLYCSMNRLTSLDVSNNMELIELFCFFNDLTSLDISNNEKLINIFCSLNHMTVLDVSKMAVDSNNQYHLYCGQQNVQHSSGEPEPLTLTLTMRENQKEHWNSSLADSSGNVDVILAN